MFTFISTKHIMVFFSIEYTRNLTLISSSLISLFLCLSLSGTTNSDSKRTKKKKPSSLSLTVVGADRGEREDRGGREGGSGGVGSGSSSQSALGLPGRKKKPKLSAPLAPSIYDDLN